MKEQFPEPMKKSRFIRKNSGEHISDETSGKRLFPGCSEVPAAEARR